MLKKFLIGILIFAVLIVSSLVVAWFNLDIILNEKNIAYARNRFSIPISWNALDIKVHNLGTKEKHFVISSKDLCFTWDKPQVQICFSHLNLEAKVEVVFQSPFVSVRDLLFVGETSAANIVLLPNLSEEPQTEKQILWPKIKVPALGEFLNPYLKWVDTNTIKKISLNIKNLQLQSQDLIVHASTELGYQNKVVSLKNHSEVHRQDTNYIKADINSSFDLKAMALKLEVDADIPFMETQIKSNLVWQDSLKMNADIESKNILASKSKLRLMGTEKSWRLDLDSNADLQKWNMGKVQLSQCSLDLELNRDGTAKELHFPCGIELMGVQKLSNRHLPSTALVTLTNKNVFTQSGDSLQIASNIQVNSKDNTLISVAITGQSDVAINLKSYALEKISLPNLSAELKIEKVKSWHEIFKKNNVPLPAPLNVLDGPIQLTTRVHSADLNIINTETELITDLKGQNQKLITNSKANLLVDLKNSVLRLNGESSLREIAVDLPYIGLEAPPQFLPDSRFEGIAKEKKVKSSKWKFEIEKFVIRTPERPIIVRTRLLESEIPIRVLYTLVGKKMFGTVGLDPFTIELFKKKFQITKMNVIKPAQSDIMDLDGELTYRNSEVKVTVMVIGTTAAPKVEFLSDPPLSREQIISVVLFNKSLQQLTDEDRAVAGQMNQALLSDAFGIFSLVFLSQTPIESIYYDPISKSYTARVKLDDQTSLSLGSNFDTSQQFQLRRRLGGPWSVVTELQKSQNADDMITTLIEWFKRF